MANSKLRRPALVLAAALTLLGAGCGRGGSVPPQAGPLEKTTLNVAVLPDVDATRLQRVADVMRQFGLLKQHFDIGVMLS